MKATKPELKQRTYTRQKKDYRIFAENQFKNSM